MVTISLSLYNINRRSSPKNCDEELNHEAIGIECEIYQAESPISNPLFHFLLESKYGLQAKHGIIVEMYINPSNCIPKLTINYAFCWTSPSSSVSIPACSCVFRKVVWKKLCKENTPPITDRAKITSKLRRTINCFLWI